MKRRFIDYAITALAAGSAAYVKEGYFREPGREYVSYGMSILAGLFVFLALNFVRHLIERTFRLDPRYGYLGCWIEEIAKSNVPHYSLFEIKHSLIGDKFQVTGNTYDAKTHKPYADWGSTAVAFPEDNTLYYLHKSIIYGRAGDISGLTRLNFVGSNARFYEGTGYLIDNCEPLYRVHFSFERLERSTIKRLTGKRKLSSKADRLCFFQKLLDERQKKIDAEP
jgi:hypothetical protein